jgi:hypothetical protein
MLFQKAASAAAEKVEFRVDLAFTPAYMPLKIRVSFSPEVFPMDFSAASSAAEVTRTNTSGAKTWTGSKHRDTQI